MLGSYFVLCAFQNERKILNDGKLSSFVLAGFQAAA